MNGSIHSVVELDHLVEQLHPQDNSIAVSVHGSEREACINCARGRGWPIESRGGFMKTLDCRRSNS